MRRVIAIAAAGASLAGCSSFSWDYFKPTPPTMQVQLESTPPGADARTSLGPGCKTPCSVSVPAPDGGFTVSYTLNKFEPVTVPVQVNRSGVDVIGSSVTTDPNPVFAELRPAAPPPRGARKMLTAKKPRPPRNATVPPPPGSAFPDPAQAPPPR